MKRRTLHLAFGGAALACGAFLAGEGYRLHAAIGINRALQHADAWAANTRTGSTDARDPRVDLGRALALARAGEQDAALKGFDALIARGGGDAIARAASFDAGNLYLRRALHDSGNRAVALPFIELAKQRYRDALRYDPTDWNARFNLERALRLAPEDKEAFEQPEDRPLPQPPNKPPDLLAPDLP